jgi:hypothetical protein
VSNNQNSRLLLELEKIRRDVNREIMNPAIPELGIEDFKPIVTMAARARLAYLQELVDIVRLDPEMPSHEQITMLARKRERYDELRMAVNALETAIERGYLDVLEH